MSACGTFRTSVDVRSPVATGEQRTVYILQEAKPGGLSSGKPVKFQFVINRKTAKMVGLEFQPKLLFTAEKLLNRPRELRTRTQAHVVH